MSNKQIIAGRFIRKAASLVQRGNRLGYCHKIGYHGHLETRLQLLESARVLLAAAFELAPELFKGTRVDCASNLAVA